MAWNCLNGNTLTYIKGSDLPDTAIFWLDRADQLINLTGYTFSLTIQNEAGTDLLVPAKTTNITGQAGSGTAPLGTPNLIITWVNGELDSLNVGVYTMRIEATTGGRTRKLVLTLIVERQTKLDWSYSGNPSASSLDAVRFLIGDTDGTDPLLYDGEINWVVTEEGNVYAAAAKAAQAVASKFARLMDRSVGNLSASYSMKFRQYTELAQTLDQQAKAEPVAPWASGWSKSAKETVAIDTDREPIFAYKGSMDNPGGQSGDEYYTQRYPWPA